MATQELKWWHLAECQYVDTEMFFPEKTEGGATTAMAKRICAVCEVKTECLEAALQEERGMGRQVRYGVRGGETPNSRYRIAKERGEFFGDDNDDELEAA